MDFLLDSKHFLNKEFSCILLLFWTKMQHFKKMKSLLSRFSDLVSHILVNLSPIFIYFSLESSVSVIELIELFKLHIPNCFHCFLWLYMFQVLLFQSLYFLHIIYYCVYIIVYFIEITSRTILWSKVPFHCD